MSAKLSIRYGGMFRPVVRSLNVRQGRFYGTNSKTSDPLRILFCGSDDFSGTALVALYNEHVSNPSLIESIDVVVRPGKRTGRNLKSVREVPIKAVAQELNLQIHERDTFTGWEPPRPQEAPINLIIAVSFGLLVPPRLLKAAKYGGLNVHPSLLPDLRGPAPLQHALLAGREYTGVTLQTLHPEKFDNGMILAQTPTPGLKIPNPTGCTYPELLEFISPKAADFLVQGIRDRTYVPPLRSMGQIQRGPKSQLIHAPKITAEDRQINWMAWSSEVFARRARVLGRLWTVSGKKRLIFEDCELVAVPDPFWDLQRRREEKKANGTVYVEPVCSLFSLPVAHDHGRYSGSVPFVLDGGSIILWRGGDKAVKVNKLTWEGEKQKSAKEALFGRNSNSNCMVFPVVNLADIFFC